jgi:hypothetical protein
MKKIFGLLLLSLIMISCNGGDGNNGKANASEPAPKTTVHAYDADGQYLGVLLSIDPIEVFIPSFGYAVRIGPQSGNIYRKGGGRYINYRWIDLHFLNPDCIGDRYVGNPNILVLDYDGRYFVGVDGPYDNIEPCDGDIPQQSYINPDGICQQSNCSPVGGGPDYWNGSRSNPIFRAIEILEEDIPFTLPVAVPLSYVYE